MLEWLAHIDTAVFYFVNVSLANPVTDFVMPIITEDDYLRIGYGLAMLLCLWRGDARLRWLVLFSLIALTLSDQTSSNLLKHSIERIRPCRALEDVHLLVGCGGGYSMPSSHAANSFAQAALFSFFYKQPRWPLFLFATAVAFSRVFVGVHYPGDILVGALVGTAVAGLVACLYVLFVRRFVKQSAPSLPPDSKSTEEGN